MKLVKDGEGSLAGDVLRDSAKSQDGLWQRQSTRGGGGGGGKVSMGDNTIRNPAPKQMIFCDFGQCPKVNVFSADVFPKSNSVPVRFEGR